MPSRKKSELPSKKFDQIKIDGANNEIVVPDIINNFGGLLRQMRDNHGYTIADISRKTGLSAFKISQIENGNNNLPEEKTLRHWLLALGCGVKVTNRLILVSRQFKTKQQFMLIPNEESNPHILRILEYYNREALTNFDRALLAMVARHPLPNNQ
jgi:transcriptional regulator with XRE-family HTH domain